MDTLIEIRTTGDEPEVVDAYTGRTEAEAWACLVRLTLSLPEVGADTLTSDQVDLALDELRDQGRSAHVVKY